MKHNQPGTILIFIVLMFSILGVCVANVWNTVVFALQISHKRQRAEQRYRSTQALITYGLLACKQRFQRAGNEGMTTIVIPSWPCDKQGAYEGELAIKRLEPERVSIQAQLRAKARTFYSIACRLTRVVPRDPHEQIRFIIDDWTINPKT